MNTPQLHNFDDCKISSRIIYSVPVTTISGTPYNPKHRTKEGKKLNQLIDKIKEFGVAYPILITQDRFVIDGNRRLAACRALSFDSIECIVLDIDRDEAFCMTNTTAVPLGGKDWLELGRGGGKLPPQEQKLYGELVELIGLNGVDFLIEKRIGLNILRLCKYIHQFGISIPLSELVLVSAKNKLSNKLNAVVRSSVSKKDKVELIELILRSV